MARGYPHALQGPSVADPTRRGGEQLRRYRISTTKSRPATASSFPYLRQPVTLNGQFSAIWCCRRRTPNTHTQIGCRCRPCCYPLRSPLRVPTRPKYTPVECHSVRQDHLTLRQVRNAPPPRASAEPAASLTVLCADLHPLAQTARETRGDFIHLVPAGRYT